MLNYRIFKIVCININKNLNRRSCGLIINLLMNSVYLIFFNIEEMAADIIKKFDIAKINNWKSINLQYNFWAGLEIIYLKTV